MVAETEQHETEAEESTSTAVTEYEGARDITPARSGNMTPMDMLEVAINSGRDLDVIDKLMDLQERWERNQGKKAFDNAVADAKAEIPPVVKNRQGHNAKYADFSAYARAIDPVLSRRGLSYRFRTTQNGDAITVSCVLSHRDGYSEENSLTAGADKSGNKNAIQAIGSTVMYLQRYTLTQALGLAATEDDDGHGATGTVERIGDAHISNLRREMKELNVSEAKFCALLKIDTLESMPADRFAHAVEVLAVRRAQGGGNATAK